MTHKLSPTNNSQRHHRRRTLPVSITAIGWVSMLFAVSGVTSAYTSRTSLRTKNPNSESRASIFSTSQSRANRITRTNADTFARINSFSSTTPTTLSQNSRVSSSSTRLQYMNEGDNSERHNESFTNLQRLWSVVTPERKETSRQDQVDEYLEWLDKRYNRLHGEEQVPAKPKFSAWNWLVGEDDEEEVPFDNSQEDALYVLGVAELASERLLQKHQLPVLAGSPTSIHSGTVIDTTSVHAYEAEQTNPVLSPLVKIGAAVLTQIKARRKALLQYQNVNFRAAIKFVVQSLKKTPKARTSIYKWSGANKTLGLTVSIVATFLFLIRPLLQSMLTDVAV